MTNKDLKGVTLEEKLRLAYEAGITFPHYTNTDNPSDFPNSENIKAGADIHSGDGGYSVGTKEKYDEFIKGRNQSLELKNERTN